MNNGATLKAHVYAPTPTRITNNVCKFFFFTKVFIYFIITAEGNIITTVVNCRELCFRKVKLRLK